MGLDKNDRFGTTERGICELSQALVQEGHEVLVLYRNHVKGDYLFPLDNQVKRHRISGESAALSDTAKIRREILRLFSPDMARRMTETCISDSTLLLWLIVPTGRTLPLWLSGNDMQQQDPITAEHTAKS